VLETLRRIVQEVNEARDLDQALQIIVQSVKQVMKTDVCSVYLTDFSNHDRVLMATDGLNPKSVGRVRLKQNEGVTSVVCERAEPLNLEDAPSHPKYKYLPETEEEDFHAFLGVPIIHHRKTLGVLVVQQLQKRSFDDNEVTLLMTIAAQLAGAIAHAEASGGIDGLRQSSDKRLMHRDRPFRGLPGAPGVAKGLSRVLYPSADLDAVPNRHTENTEKEKLAFLNAVEATRKDINVLKLRVAQLPEEDRALFDAYLLILESDSLIKKTLSKIDTGLWASTALRDVVQEQVKVFAAMEDEYLSERSQDIKDLGRRILVHLQSKQDGVRSYEDNTVLVGDELAASDLVEVPPDKLVAVVCTQGSGSSHVAILARALGVPAVMGAQDLPTSKVDALNIIVDGYQGCIYINPSETVHKEYERLINEEAELSAGLETLKGKPAETPDGVRVPLYVNSGLLADISTSLESGAEGIGLYRTEFPFMIRDQFPGEDEQAQIYKQVLSTFAGKPVILRTLDVGGDKNLSYFPIKEDNPFLGWRGIRISLDHPDIFTTQLRAMLRASAGQDNLHILFPMITSIDEVKEAVNLVNRAREELLDEGKVDIHMPRIGAMIEVPSAVYEAESIAKRVDFLSIGTNDLVQYLLAVDRNNSQVADLYDCLHPAVIRAVLQVMQAASKQQIPVSVCGEMAGDPAAALLLLGMGLNSLSMSTIALPRIKWVIRSFTQQRAKELLEQALQLEGAKEIRHLLNREIDNAGLGGLLRPGK